MNVSPGGIAILSKLKDLDSKKSNFQPEKISFNFDFMKFWFLNKITFQLKTVLFIENKNKCKTNPYQ
jgi:hypothetical protein